VTCPGAIHQSSVECGFIKMWRAAKLAARLLLWYLFSDPLSCHFERSAKREVEKSSCCGNTKILRLAALAQDDISAAALPRKRGDPKRIPSGCYHEDKELPLS